MPESKVTAGDRRNLLLEWPLLTSVNGEGFSHACVVLVVIRHLYTFLEDDETPNYDTEHTVIKAARLHLGGESSAEYRNAAIHLQKRAVYDLLTERDTPTIDMFHSKLLNQHLWSREVFHLWKPRELTRQIGQHGPSSDPNGYWQLADETHPDDMTTDSLIFYDGTNSISECFSSEFGVFNDDQNGWQYVRFPGLNTFLRVHYQPKERRSYEQLRLLTAKVEYNKIEFLRLQFEGEPDKYLLKPFDEKPPAPRYSLVAAVRLGKQGEKDIVRLYDEIGNYVQPPMYATSIIDDEPRIGQDDREWLLFYAMLKEEPSDLIQEVVIHNRPAGPPVANTQEPDQLLPGSLGESFPGRRQRQPRQPQQPSQQQAVQNPPRQEGPMVPPATATAPQGNQSRRCISLAAALNLDPLIPADRQRLRQLDEWKDATLQDFREWQDGLFQRLQQETQRDHEKQDAIIQKILEPLQRPSVQQQKQQQQQGRTIHQQSRQEVSLQRPFVQQQQHQQQQGVMIRQQPQQALQRPVVPQPGTMLHRQLQQELQGPFVLRPHPQQQIRQEMMARQQSQQAWQRFEEQFIFQRQQEVMMRQRPQQPPQEGPFVLRSPPPQQQQQQHPGQNDGAAPGREDESRADQADDQHRDKRQRRD